MPFLTDGINELLNKNPTDPLDFLVFIFLLRQNIFSKGV
jgi:hypothetical protein